MWNLISIKCQSHFFSSSICNTYSPVLSTVDANLIFPDPDKFENSALNKTSRFTSIPVLFVGVHTAKMSPLPMLILRRLSSMTLKIGEKETTWDSETNDTSSKALL